MSEWKEYKLGEIAVLKGGKRLPKGKLLVDFETPYPYIRITDMTKKWITKSNLMFVEPHIQKAISRYTVNSGDVILSIVGSIGFVARISIEIDGANLTENCVKVLPNKQILNADYLYYYLKSPFGQEEIEKRNVGAVQPKLPIYNINEIAILLPPLPEQTRIAGILSSLDDKIDLLTRQNRTLEAMAETLFREYFIESPKEEWEEKSLFDCIKLVGGGTPKTSIETYWDGDICWLSGGDISDNHKGYITRSEKTISTEGLSNSSAKLLPTNATVISARGTVGKYCLLSKPMAFSQSNYGVLPQYSNCYYFTFLLIAYSVSELQSAAYGSVFDTITTNSFKSLTLCLPDDKDIYSFELLIQPYFDKIRNNTLQICTLTKLRDTLLPKLMNNEKV